MRQLVLSPRWIFWHLLTLGAMATCGWLAVWQWQRAGSAMGSALNVGYGLQWPVFAVFFGVMWWRMLRMEASALRVAEGEGGGPEPDPAAPASPTAAPSSAGTAPVDERPDGSRPAPEGPSPFGPSPFGPRPARAASSDAEDDPELAAYNRMLARLAVHDSDR